MEKLLIQMYGKTSNLKVWKNFQILEYLLVHI
jgi:hypothetical protein